MTFEQKNFWVTIVQRLGLPTVMLGVVTFGMYRSAQWAAPHIDTLIQKHVEIVDTSTDMSRRGIGIAETNSQTLQVVGSAVDKLGNAVQNQTQLIVEIHNATIKRERENESSSSR